MYHENKLRINQILFLICCVFALISPSYNQEVVQAKPEEKTNSGVEWKVYAPISNSGKTNPEKELDKWSWVILESKDFCWPNCKVATLTGIWIDERLAMPLISGCKRLATDPRHCIIVWASVITAESGGKLANCYHKNCTWLWWWRIWYDTYEAGIIDWITRYSKYWYKAKSANFFYPPVGEKSKSRYCTSENSSWSAVGCPMWLKHASSTWSKLNKLF